MHAYRYTIEAAGFVIYPDNGRWGLMINGDRVNDYSSPDAAAYDVSVQNTGYLSWDSLEDVEVPEYIQDWECFEFDPAYDRM